MKKIIPTVMVTIFVDLNQFPANNMAFFLYANTMIIIIHKWLYFELQSDIFSSNFFGEKYLLRFLQFRLSSLYVNGNLFLAGLEPMTETLICLGKE
jgi:hypothetical protein